MKAFMTNGTASLMNQIIRRHPDLLIHRMENHITTLIYYEDPDKNIFKAGRAYDIISQTGEIEERGVVALNYIPLTPEGMPVFEYRFKERRDSLSLVEGFQAFRLLKPLSGNTYVALTQWRFQRDYQAWTESEHFATAHQNQALKPSTYLAGEPFVTTYLMGDGEEETIQTEFEMDENNIVAFLQAELPNELIQDTDLAEIASILKTLITSDSK